ncbi:MAG TPA: glutamate cyclase domain-containing protein [Solirubrobacterales bacterium]|nr:glutamate cyclase domain-containing protein [Solirubrobacterales bacterium]
MEAIVGRDVGRNIGALVQEARNGLLGAARSIARHPEPTVAVMTGVFIPWAEPPAAETDGPIGSAELAVGLTAAGWSARVVTDEQCADAVRASLEAAGTGVDIPLDVVPVSAGARDAVGSLISRYQDDVGVTHMVAVERLGPGRDGRVYDMSGRDVSTVTAPLDELFSAANWTRIGIGDGGNELGMGTLPAKIVAANVDLGERIHCVVPCDHLIVSGTSNWGAQALLAAIAVLRKERAGTLLERFTPEGNSAILRDTVAKGPAVDGVTQTRENSVDGLPAEDHARMIQEILKVVEDLD